MTLWSRSHSLQHKIITAIVMVGLLPLTLLLALTYVEERRALREMTGANFKEVAVEAARRIEMQVSRGMNEAQQLATTPFLRTGVSEANRTYEGKDAHSIQGMIKDWQQRWRQRDKKSEFPLFINRIVTNYLIRWHDIRKSDYVGILVTDQQGALVVSSIPQVEYFYGKTAWWQAVVKGGSPRSYVSEIAFDPGFGTHVVVVAAPIVDDTQGTVIGAVTILLRRDTIFHAIADVTIGATGHAMLFSSDGVPVICPVLTPEEHSVRPELVAAIRGPKAGWANVADDSHGSRNALVGFAPVRLGDSLAQGSLGGKQWITVVRQDPQETYAPLGELVAKVLLYGLLVLAVLVGTGVVVARRIARPIQLLHDGVREIGSGRLDRRLELKTGDEIEGLADAFNLMATNLQRSFAQVEQRVVDVRRLEEKYRDLIEHSPEMIYQLNRSGHFVHVNKTGLEKLKYTLDEMLSMRLWELVPRGQESLVLQYLERLVAQGRSSIETVFLAKDGHPIDVEIHATALIDQERGGLVYSRAFVRDVTERHRLEQQLQEYTTTLEQAVSERTQQLVASQARYKALFDLVADSVFMVDASAMIVAVNKREEQALGYAEANVVGRSLLEVVLSGYHDALRGWLSDIITGQGKVSTQEIMVRHAGGLETPAEMDLIRVGVADQLLVMVQLRDITDRKRLERQLETYREELEDNVRERTREIEETKQYLENLLENANDVIYTLDTEQRFTYVNSKIEAWGYRKDDLLGRPYLALLSKRHRGRRLKSTLDIGAKQVYEVEVVTRTGEPRAVMVSVSPLHAVEGGILGVLGIARDMTETKKLEQQIRNSEKLASVGRLAAGVAHEINNPLGGILNCLYNLRKGTLSASRQEEYRVSMEDGVRRVQKIVRQLLDFSQQHEPEFALTDINHVVDRVLVLTTHLFAPNRIMLETVLGHGLPNVMVDRHMIEQVLMNLVLNAVQAMKDGGVLTIRTSVVEGICLIEVRDTGSGIPPAILPRIFDPFFTTKGEGEGTGLGLSVSLGIVERHGGKILVDSEVGKGDDLYPLSSCLPGAFIDGKGVMMGLKILLVDDEPLMRLSMVDGLETIGHDVEAAATGTEGIAAIRQRPFDLVITDLRLPGADGLTVLKATKERSPQTEVVVITAHGSVETAVGAMKFGAFDYITKPFQMDELLLIVERVSRVVTLRRENQDLKSVLEDKFSFGGILGSNSQMRAVLEKIKLVAGTDSTTLILGESGTGKELVANAIHQNSTRSHYPLIKVSCAALPESLLEAELFGHEKGAFTGALRQRRGRFELAHRGTLFLDEIGEISPVVQVKLLRVLQERQFERVGGNDRIDVDVRLVCATQKDLRKEVSHGRFREDLFYRLNVVHVVIPPLRQRQEDIMIIAEHVLKACAGKMNKTLKGFSPVARELFLRYSFPGNVRELENMVERAVALGRDRDAIQPSDLCGFQSCPFTGGLPQESCGFCSEGLAGQKREERPLTSLATAREQFEREYIVSVLGRVEGSRTTASKILGLSRKALWEKCKRYGIPSAKDEPDQA